MMSNYGLNIYYDKDISIDISLCGHNDIMSTYHCVDIMALCPDNDMLAYICRYNAIMSTYMLT